MLFVQENVLIPSLVDGDTKTRVILAIRLGTPPSTQNTTVKNMKDITKCYAQCATFSGPRESTETVTFSRTVQSAGCMVQGGSNMTRTICV